MPCEIQAWEIPIIEKESNKKEYGKWLTDAQLLDVLLCEACGIIKEADPTLFLAASEALNKWWKKHEAEDLAKSKRRAAQKNLDLLRNRAIEKLTQAEREALGV